MARTRPANIPTNSRWFGPVNPGAGWQGVGAGWWAPTTSQAARTPITVTTTTSTPRPTVNPGGAMGRVGNRPGAYRPTGPPAATPSAPSPTPATPPGTPMPTQQTFDPMTDPTYASIYGAEHTTVGGAIAKLVRQAVAGQQAADALDYTQDVPLSHQTFHQYGLDRLAAMIAANRRAPSVTSSASGDAWYGSGGAIANQYGKNYTTAETNAGQFEADTGVDRYGNIITTPGSTLAAPGTTIGNLQTGEQQYDVGPAQDALGRAIAAWQANPANQTPAPGAPTGGGGGGTITTHQGGPFYTAYVKAYGHAPPSTVSVTSPAYAAWKAGKPLPRGGGR